jgi:small subunit ribosomal protein S6
LPLVSRQYEAVYIFDTTLEDAAIADKLNRFHSLLRVEGDIAMDHWGRRQLAYSIGPRENGYYVVARFSADPTSLPEYERALKLDDSVIRYLISLHERELGAPIQAEDALAVVGRDDEDEDEE